MRTKMSKKSQKRLLNKGILIFPDTHIWHLLKKKRAKGNRIPEWETHPIGGKLSKDFKIVGGVTSDCPILEYRQWRGGEYSVYCWDWTPGPGPGDFKQTFHSEEEAINCILHYFFEENEHFEARKAYEIQSILERKRRGL